MSSQINQQIAVTANPEIGFIFTHGRFEVWAKIKQLINGELLAGKHSVVWNARNGENSKVEPGVYVCRMLLGNQAELSKQLVVVK